MSRTKSMENRERRRILKFKRKLVRATKRMIRYTHQAAYQTSLSHLYATLCTTNNWETIDEIITDFRYELDNIEGE